MSEYLTSIIEQAKKIQQIAQQQLNNEECLCKLININDIIINLQQIAQTFQEELHEKEKIISTLQTDKVKLKDQVFSEMALNEKLKLLNVRLTEENNKNSDQRLSNQQILISQLSQKRIKSMYTQHKDTSQQYNLNYLSNVSNFENQKTQSSKKDKDQVMHRSAFISSKSTERFQNSKPTNDYAKTLMQLSVNNQNRNLTLQFKSNISQKENESMK